MNVTDPDSRLMTHGAGGVGAGYNAQVAVTDDHLILGVHVSQDANDTHCFAPALSTAMLAATGLDLQIETVLADAGYSTEENLTMPGPDRLIAPGKHRDLPTGTDPVPGSPPGDATPQELMRDRLRPPRTRRSTSEDQPPSRPSSPTSRTTSDSAASAAEDSPQQPPS